MRLRYWIKAGFTNTAVLVMATAIFMVMMLIQGMEVSREAVLLMATLYLLLFGGLMSMLLNMTAYKLNLPIALCFGSTRKEALIGLQCFQLIPAVLIVAVTLVMSFLVGEAMIFPPFWVVSGGFGVFLIFSALGSAMGIISVKFGKGVVVACSFIIGLVMAGFASGIGVATAFVSDGAINIPDYLPWVFLLVGVIAYGGILIPGYKIVYQYNVKL